MKYLVAAIGGLLIFVCVFLLLGLILGALFKGSHPRVVSLLALIFASLAATHSIRATLKRKAQKK